MNDGYETLIITFSEPIEVLDGRFEDHRHMGRGQPEEVGGRLRDHTLHPDKRLYGSHHIRIQHEARKGMVEILHAHSGNEGIVEG